MCEKVNKWYDTDHGECMDGIYKPQQIKIKKQKTEKNKTRNQKNLKRYYRYIIVFF
jgi:hypothetical protein